MAIAFSREQWQEIKDRNQRWRRRELGRPLMQITLTGRSADRPKPPVPRVDKTTTAYDPRYAPEQIVDRWDWELSCRRFPADGFPHVWLDFGAGALAVFLGGEAEVGLDTVWFRPGAHQGRPIEGLHLRFDETNSWFQRVRAIGSAAAHYWDGLVQVGMTDLGGTLDVLSTFRPSEQLLLDLYDHPDEVKRLTWEIHNAWFRAYDLLDRAMRPPNPGSSNWAGVFSEEPGYMLQCDFAYMIGPDMFDEFVKPELTRACERLGGRAFYHLDGVGQLPHLDSLLSIETLAGIQWIPGDGQRPVEQWPEVYRKIRDGGKLIQVFGTPRTLDVLAEQLGTVEPVLCIMSGPISNEAEFRDCVKKYGGDWGPTSAP